MALTSVRYKSGVLWQDARRSVRFEERGESGESAETARASEGAGRFYQAVMEMSPNNHSPKVVQVYNITALAVRCRRQNLPQTTWPQMRFDHDSAEEELRKTSAMCKTF